MRSPRNPLLALLLALACGCAVGGTRFGSGHLVEWVPIYGSGSNRLSVYAAQGKSANTVVVYTDAIGQLPEPLARFALLRADAIAFLAADAMRRSSTRSQSFDVRGSSQRLPFAGIDEETVRAHPLLRQQGELGLSCVAYVALGADRRQLEGLLTSASSQAMLARLAGISLVPRSRDFAFFESAACSALAGGFRG